MSPISLYRVVEKSFISQLNHDSVAKLDELIFGYGGFAAIPVRLGVNLYIIVDVTCALPFDPLSSPERYPSLSLISAELDDGVVTISVTIEELSPVDYDNLYKGDDDEACYRIYKVADPNLLIDKALLKAHGRISKICEYIILTTYARI